MRRARPGTSRRCVLAAAVLLAAGAGSGGTSAAQAPAQAQLRCAWIQLAAGDERSHHSLVTYPGVGVLAYGGVDQRPTAADLKDDARILDVATNPTGEWRDLRPSGVKPGDRAEHTSVLRTGGLGPPEMITYGGMDTAPTAATGTLPAQPAGAKEVPQAPAAPTTLQSLSYRLSLAATSAAWSRIDIQGQRRAQHAAIYDPVEDAMIVFGGRLTADADSADNSTWRLTLGDSPQWQRFLGGGDPTRRFGHSAVYDSRQKRMIVFGGTTDWHRGMNDLHFLELVAGWSSAQWVHPTPSGTLPPARFDHAAVYMPNQNWMVVYGGTPDGSGVLSDLHALDLNTIPPTWRAIATSGRAPIGLTAMAAAYSEIGDYAVFYGGESQSDSKREAYGLRCDVPAPTATNTPPASATPTPSRTPRSTAVASPTTPVRPTSTPTPSRTALPSATATLTPIDRWYAYCPFLVRAY